MAALANEVWASPGVARPGTFTSGFSLGTPEFNPGAMVLHKLATLEVFITNTTQCRHQKPGQDDLVGASCLHHEKLS